MSRRRMRALTIVLLGLLLAAPLSSGDKGLWLSLTSAAAHLVKVESGSLPAEHAVIVPERTGRAARIVGAPGAGRAEATRGLGPAGADQALGSTERWTILDSVPPYQRGEPFADHPAPRAPPA